MRPITEEVRDSLGGLLAGAAGSGLIKVTLMGIVTKAAASLIKSAITSDVAGSGVVPRPKTGQGSTAAGPRVDT